jgi:hypothetical protein
MFRIMTVMALQPTVLENPGMELPVMGLIQTFAKRELMDVQAALRAVQTAREIQQRFVMTALIMTVTGQQMELIVIALYPQRLSQLTRKVVIKILILQAMQFI